MLDYGKWNLHWHSGELHKASLFVSLILTIHTQSSVCPVVCSASCSSWVLVALSHRSTCVYMYTILMEGRQMWCVHMYTVLSRIKVPVVHVYIYMHVCTCMYTCTHVGLELDNSMYLMLCTNLHGVRVVKATSWRPRLGFVPWKCVCVCVHVNGEQWRDRINTYPLHYQ